jgi:hypothetical protein
MSLNKLKEKLAVLEERQATAERELRAIKGRKEELEQLKRDRDAVLAYYTALAPETFDSLGPEERHRLYGMLRLRVLWFENGQAWTDMPIRQLTSLEEDPGAYRTGVSRQGLPARLPDSQAYRAPKLLREFGRV